MESHVCAVDGYSGKIVGFITMPVKNNIEIYTNLFPVKRIQLACNSVSNTFLHIADQLRFSTVYGTNSEWIREKSGF